MTSVRSFGSGHGKVLQHIQVNGTAGVTKDTVVVASVAEWNRDADSLFIGDARMTVCNVAPGPGYVDVWVQIDWDSDLNFRVALLIDDGA